MNEKDLEEQIKEIENTRFPKDGWNHSIGGDPLWYPIIVDLDKRLGAIDPDYTILQVKAKFGELRFYYKTKPEFREKFRELVSEAESKAYEISKGER